MQTADWVPSANCDQNVPLVSTGNMLTGANQHEHFDLILTRQYIAVVARSVSSVIYHITLLVIQFLAVCFLFLRFISLTTQWLCQNQVKGALSIQQKIPN